MHVVVRDKLIVGKTRLIKAYLQSLPLHRLYT